MENSILSLYELNYVIKRTLSDGLPDLYWIRAETSDVRENQNGHCYLEFIQKDEKNRTIIAKARGSIWANVYQMLKLYFMQQTGQAFGSGMKVLVQVSVEFHELYGFSLNVHNIDPAYTLGDQARVRTEIINQLKEEGVLDLNKELELPELTNRIAIISSPTAAGYEDFCNQLENNTSGFIFYTHLFPAIMQGDKTEDSILSALDKVFENMDLFDTVVIIRGGGATSDLSSFDSYMLAASCAQFPLPIITGIGHERDDTVLDVVAHTRAKTPTAVAEFLINRTKDAEIKLLSLQDEISENIQQILHNESLRLSVLTTRFSYILKEKTQERLVGLSRIILRLRSAAENYMKDKRHHLGTHEQYLRLSSPENILKKGYTLTLKDKIIVKNPSRLKNGDEITTLFSNGSVKSVVKND